MNPEEDFGRRVRQAINDIREATTANIECLLDPNNVHGEIFFKNTRNHFSSNWEFRTGTQEGDEEFRLLATDGQGAIDVSTPFEFVNLFEKIKEPFSFLVGIARAAEYQPYIEPNIAAEEWAEIKALDAMLDVVAELESKQPKYDVSRSSIIERILDSMLAVLSDSVLKELPVAVAVERGETKLEGLRVRWSRPKSLVTERSPSLRELSIRPLLKEKGWSTHDWAVQSNVDFHTADRYLRGESSPFPSTRKKLADSLEFTINDLPL